MTSKHFVMINVETDHENVTERLRPLLDRAIDWIEISPLSWLTWTSSSSKIWARRLKLSSVGFNSVFVVEINVADRAGEMPKNFWEFIRKYEHVPPAGGPA